MTMKRLVQQQYRDKVNRVIERFLGLDQPKEGWLRTVRKALNMSGAQLARRMGVTRALVSNTERAELTGNVTLKKMQEMAEAMQCRFVYALVPEQNINDIVLHQARQKARAQVMQASTHVALEAQTLSDAQLESEIERLAAELVATAAKDIWEV